MKFRKDWKLSSRAGKKKYLMDTYKGLKKHRYPVKIVKLKKPVGKHKYGLYYKPTDLRTK